MARKNVIRALAGTAGVLLVAGAAGPGAAAVTMEDSGDVQATVRKTVLQTATAAGEILTSRMYTQVSAVGNGTKTVLVPVGDTSNRNLNAFGAFPMEGESIQFDLTVDGGVEERTLTDADINPMEVSVKVTLDGVEIQPEDVVGASGVLDVQYTVRNTTATTSPVTYADVEGTEITEDLETADPYVGSLDVTLPQGFNEVTAPGATIAGNGQNQTSLGFTFVLFPPLGSPEVTVGYQARIDGGVMPPADFSFLPIVPFDQGQIAGATDAYRGGAAVGAQIFGAGTEIGDNLLKLQDGASQLVAGLGQLAAGAVQISDGLVNTAAPGAEALADGSAQVSDGLNQLNSQIPALADGTAALDAGANQISDGLNELDSNVPALAAGVTRLDKGAGDLNSGADQLAAGMAALNDGLKLLSQGVATLPENAVVKGGVDQLQAALKGVQDAIGKADDSFVPEPKTLNGAINALEFGLNNPGCDPDDPQAAANPCGFKQVLTILSEKLSSGTAPSGVPSMATLQAILGALDTGGALQATQYMMSGDMLKCGVETLESAYLTAVFTQLQMPTDVKSCGGVARSVANADPALSTYEPELAFLIQGGLIADIGSDSTPDTALYAIAELIAGIGSAADFPSTPGTLYYGLEGIRTGLTNPNCDPTDPQNAANPCGIKQIQGLVSQGITDLVAGISAALLQSIGTAPAAKGCDPTKTLTCASAALTVGAAGLADGTQLLLDGTGQLNAQVPTLAAGVNQLAEGGETLADGTGELNSKVPALASGVEQLDAGAAQVAEGNSDLADGLGAAADGSEQLVDGLASAEPGGAQIEQGAGDLKEQGADVLAQTGKDAQIGYARDVALLEASQQAGLEGAGIPFGNAVGTDVITTAAVQMQLAGIAPDTTDDALKIGLGVLLIAGAAGAAFAATRRVTA